MFEDVGIEKTTQWLKQDMLGCLNKFFCLCNTSDYLKDREYVEYSRIQIKNMHMFLKHSTLPTALFLIFRSETFMSCYLGSTKPMLGMHLCLDLAVMRESGVQSLATI